ncbi:MAG: iron-sulfur cluster assembly accessory protein [Chloroflexota bacterium]|nr:iron-sulfur cluster assembly accessory protein [Chloroflexota bacterium]
MIQLTPTAAAKLHELRDAGQAQQVLRLWVAGRTCCGYSYGLAFDAAADAEDEVVEREGIAVAVDPRSLPFVKGATIDFVDALMGAGFTVRDASVGTSCACGGR